MSEPSHSISIWIHRLRQNDPEAARILWERFYPRMSALARRRLGEHPRRAADEEDAAAAAFADFDQAMKAGRFPDLNDRDGLWALLLTFTVRKVQNQVRGETRRGGAPVSDSALRNGAHEPDGDPFPDEQAAFQDGLESLLHALPREELAILVLRKLEGYTNDEVARLLKCSRATVERRLNFIRRTWQWLLERDEKSAE